MLKPYFILFLKFKKKLCILETCFKSNLLCHHHSEIYYSKKCIPEKKILKLTTCVTLVGNFFKIKFFNIKNGKIVFRKMEN